MNKNRKFLMPLAALASVFVTNSAVANINSTEPEISPTSINSPSDKVSSAVFKFILKTPSQSQFMAYHSSHASHSSHQSGS